MVLARQRRPSFCVGVFHPTFSNTQTLPSPSVHPSLFVFLPCPTSAASKPSVPSN